MIIEAAARLSALRQALVDLVGADRRAGLVAHLPIRGSGGVAEFRPLNGIDGMGHLGGRWGGYGERQQQRAAPARSIRFDIS